jgi:hypothetical protein
MANSLSGYTGMKSGSGTGGGMKSGAGISGTKVPKGYSHGQLNNYTPEQEQLFQQGFENVGPESYLSKLAGGDQDMFNQLEAPAMQQFSELQGGLSSRFSGMGMGARHSSGFQNTANQATSQFAQQLQAQRMGLQQQAIKDLHGMSQDLLNQRPYEQMLTEKPKSFLHEAGVSFAGGVGQGVGQAAGKWATGGI